MSAQGPLPVGHKGETRKGRFFLGHSLDHSLSLACSSKTMYFMKLRLCGKEMATHSNIFPRTEEPGGLQSVRVTKESDRT